MRSPTRRNHSAGGGERGSVTAEFAAVIPAVILVLGAALGCMQVAGEQLRLQDATADAARMLARGDGAGAASSRLTQAVPGAHLTVRHRGDLVCVVARARSSAGGGLLSALTVRADGCALDAGG